MKLNELTGYKSNQLYQDAKNNFKNQPPSDTSMKLDYNRYDQFIKWNNYMKAHGFKHLGEGNFASVYEHPSYPWVFKVFKNDSGYMHFFQYAKANQNNPNLPKIKGNFIKINDNTFAIRLKKLKPISNTFFIHNMAEPISIIRLLKNRNINDLDQDYQHTLLKLQKNFPGIFQIIHDMVKSKYLLDISSRNMMMRNNTPVITDPIF